MPEYTKGPVQPRLNLNEAVLIPSSGQTASHWEQVNAGVSNMFACGLDLMA